jgi:drug/metabolite transporter (DMT)-like permease
VTSLSFISVFTPAIALPLGFVLLDDRPTLLTGVGAALVLVGVMLAVTGKVRGSGIGDRGSVNRRPEGLRFTNH